MIDKLNEKIKKLVIWDISLIKLSVAASILFVLSIWPAALNWVGNTNYWWFLIAFIIFAIIPMKKFYFD
jgi:hypothetical protein